MTYWHVPDNERRSAALKWCFKNHQLPSSFQWKNYPYFFSTGKGQQKTTHLPSTNYSNPSCTQRSSRSERAKKGSHRNVLGPFTRHKSDTSADFPFIAFFGSREHGHCKRALTAPQWGYWGSSFGDQEPFVFSQWWWRQWQDPQLISHCTQGGGPQTHLRGPCHALENLSNDNKYWMQPWAVLVWPAQPGILPYPILPWDPMKEEHFASPVLS